LITTTQPALAGCWRHRGTGQDTGNQVPDVETFAMQHGLELAASCAVSDPAWNNGGGAEYKTTLPKALDDARTGKFPVLAASAAVS
jgi:hypothetical protein